MLLIILLILAGIVLLFAEVLLPGMIVGIIGGGCAIAGVALAFMDYGVMGGVAASIVTLIGSIGAFLLGGTLLPHLPGGRRLVLSSSNTAASNEPEAGPELVGRRGTAATILAPSGLVEVDGRQFQAASRSGYIARGAPVVVVAVDALKVTVDPVPAG